MSTTPEKLIERHLFDRALLSRALGLIVRAAPGMTPDLVAEAKALLTEFETHQPTDTLKHAPPHKSNLPLPKPARRPQLARPDPDPVGGPDVSGSRVGKVGKTGHPESVERPRKRLARRQLTGVELRKYELSNYS